MLPEEWYTQLSVHMLRHRPANTLPVAIYKVMGVCVITVATQEARRGYSSPVERFSNSVCQDAPRCTHGRFAIPSFLGACLRIDPPRR